MKITKQRLKEMIKEELSEAGVRMDALGNVNPSDLENKDTDDEPVMSWSTEQETAYAELRDAVKTWVNHTRQGGLLDGAAIRNAIHDALKAK